MQVKAGSDRAEGVVLIDPTTGEGYAAGGGSGDGLTDAQLRASPIPVSATALTNIDADLGATSDAAATNDTGAFSLIALVKRGLQNGTTLLSRVPASVGGRVPVEPLGIPGVARQIATTTSSANQPLTVGVGRISIFARIAPLRYSVGSAAQTANATTSHYLAAGERIDIDVPATPSIAVIRASDATADGAAEITELS